MFIRIFSAKYGIRAFYGKFAHMVDLLKFSDIIIIDIAFLLGFEARVLLL